MSTSTSPTNRKVTPRSQRPQEHRRSLFGNHDSLHRDKQDSPTRKILLDFHRLLLEQDLSLQNELNEQLAKQANLHTAALAEASAEHERVRRNAEIARERVELEIEREKTRRENEEKSRLRQEQEAKTRREEEDRQRQRLELERREREQSRRATEERELAEKRAQLEARSRQEAEEAERRKQEALDVAKQKARDAAAGAAKKREETQKAPPAPADVETPPAPRKPAAVTQPATTAAVAADPLQQEFEEQHKQYLHMHKRLKEMREYVIMESKKIPALKTRLGDWRREIRKCMGQLTADKTKNRKPMLQIQGVLNESLKYNTPAVDISPYLLSVPHPAPGQPVPYPGVALYLLSIFAKATITQFISETSGGAKSADPVGVVAVTIFATPAFKLNSTIPLIDILLAKYHVVCPALFCVSGPQTTVPGRTRLGWWRDGDTFIPEQRHLERMAGLATGWAALTLRDFSKSKNENPMPNWHYWRAIAGLTNTPTADFGSTHVTIIKGLVEGFVPRFVGFYGAAAKAVLREALVGLPRRLRADGKGQAAAGLEVLREVLQRDLKLTLT